VKNIGVTDRLSFLILGVFYSITFLVGYLHVSDRKNEENKEILDSKKLIHLVLIQFQSSMSSSDFQLITDSAYSLQQIRGVKELNFGKNTSPEGLNNGYTHSLTMKFSSAHDRDSIYLPHEIHQKFVKLFLPFTESVLVYDYWE
tara:strand:- start:3585 stop:4016 length:432 start_codon:yes stop_codon:yes gene_type:complete